MRAQDREFAKRAVANALKRDESKGMLIIRVTMVDDALQVRSGTVGCTRGFGSEASGIVKATVDTIDNFATSPTRAPPGLPARKCFDEQLAQTLQEQPSPTDCGLGV